MSGPRLLALMLLTLLVPAFYTAWLDQGRLDRLRTQGRPVQAEVVGKEERTARGRGHYLVVRYPEPSGSPATGSLRVSEPEWKATPEGAHLDLVMVPGEAPVAVSELSNRPWVGFGQALAVATIIYLAVWAADRLRNRPARPD